MKASTIASVGGWLLLIPLPVASILHAVHCFIYWGKLMDANSYVDPVGFILSYLTPVAAVGLAVLVRVRHQQRWQSWSVRLATTLFFFFTISALLFGLWCFHQLPDFYPSDLVWWLKPFRLAGV